MGGFETGALAPVEPTLKYHPDFPGILTATRNPGVRQWGCRYAIRAGRNLPDKEFRYLRTVIVTAAVYWGFGSKLLYPKVDNKSP